MNYPLEPGELPEAFQLRSDEHTRRMRWRRIWNSLLVVLVLGGGLLLFAIAIAFAVHTASALDTGELTIAEERPVAP